MMNQYHHSQIYTNFPSQHHFHVNNTTTSTVFQSPSTNSYVYDPSIIDNSYEQNELIYHPCQNYSNNSQYYSDFSLSNNPSQTIEQSSIDQKPIINEATYKWMQIKRAPPKASGIVRN
jgi:hypothetical protein